MSRVWFLSTALTINSTFRKISSRRITLGGAAFSSSPVAFAAAVTAVAAAEASFMSTSAILPVLQRYERLSEPEQGREKETGVVKRHRTYAAVYQVHIPGSAVLVVRGQTLNLEKVQLSASKNNDRARAVR